MTPYILKAALTLDDIDNGRRTSTTLELDLEPDTITQLHTLAAQYGVDLETATLAVVLHIIDKDAAP